MKVEKESEEFPKRLTTISNAPKQIYVEGNIQLLNNIGIAVIGTRNPSDYGKRMCKTFTKELVKYGVIIISGMAKGIDMIAHKTCIENGGKTIAVLPCGLNNIFPKQNEKLYKDIIEYGGVAITEYLPNEKAESKKFLERNRLISRTCNRNFGYRSRI